MPFLFIFINMLYLFESGYYGHVLSKNLPRDLDNRLYTIIHVVGGMNFEEIIVFANNANPQEIQHLHKKVIEFPSTMESLIPYAGGFGLLQDSDEYKEIKDIINFKGSSDDLLQEQTQPKWDPTFNEIIPPHLKEKLFNYWTRIGKPEWETLKLFGVEGGDGGDSFDEIIDIVYPVLKIEWEGGIDNTSFGLKKDEWRHAITNGIYDIRFKVIPTSYTYSWEAEERSEFDGSGEGHACWNLTFLIDKESWWSEWDRNRHGEQERKTENIHLIFPNKTTEDVMNSMEDHQADIIEELWEWVANEANKYFHQYCKVTVKIV